MCLSIIFGPFSLLKIDLFDQLQDHSNNHQCNLLLQWLRGGLLKMLGSLPSQLLLGGTPFLLNSLSIAMSFVDLKQANRWTLLCTSKGFRLPGCADIINIKNLEIWRAREWSRNSLFAFEVIAGMKIFELCAEPPPTKILFVSAKLSAVFAPCHRDQTRPYFAIS